MHIAVFEFWNLSSRCHGPLLCDKIEYGSPANIFKTAQAIDQLYYSIYFIRGI